jgi:hypothetical protein
MMRMHALALGIAAWLAAAGAARAGITELILEPAEPFAPGAMFGQAGEYVRIKGVARGEVDPALPANKAIADIDKAARNARGMVEYETDVFILQPKDMSKGSGVLLYDVTNRGRKFLLHWLHDAKATSPGAVNDPRTKEHAGNGLALERGHAVVWSGWDPDAPKANNGMTIRVPIATDGGRPIVQRIRDEFQVATRGPGDGLTHRLPYPAAESDPAKAQLAVRERESDKRTIISLEKWAFIDNRTIRLLPEGTKFEPVRIYELWYEATEPKVLGLGYAATRDLVAFLRSEKADQKGRPNPLLASGAVKGSLKTLAIGISQSGRYLRHFLDLGMNGDEKGRRVFDGVFAHISGAGKVFANHRFGMPNRTATQHEDRFYPESWFPFGYRLEQDHFTGRNGRIIARKPTDPKVIESNTSTEYWQKAASLVHTDPKGRGDADLPANVRVYLIAGTQHGGRAGLDDSKGLCQMPRNPHNAAPVLRALLVALEEWVVKGTQPPSSRVPRINSRTAVAPSEIRLPKLVGFSSPPGANPLGPQVDWINPPAGFERTYAVRVPQVDADGNEVAGVRLPPVAVPLGTYTGWNVYRAYPSELCDRDGSYLPFARTRAERESKGDPRLSLAERYQGKDDYVAKVKAAADALVKQRLLLERDAAAYVEQARKVGF